MMMSLETELQKIYDSEINVHFSWLWDGGIDVWIGDEMDGHLAQKTLATASEILPWLQEAIAHFFPSSNYSASLSTELRERAPRRVFAPPKIGASVTCPHGGAPNASRGMDDLFAFICTHCGEAVKVEQKIQ
jgi:hypothetical protein